METQSSPPIEEKESNCNKVLIVVIILLLLLSGFLFYRLKTSQCPPCPEKSEVTPSASPIAKKGGVVLGLEASSIGQGEEAEVKIFIDPADEAISGVSVQVFIQSSQGNESFEILDGDSLKEGIQAKENPEIKNDFSFPVNKILTRENKVLLSLAAINISTTGYKPKEKFLLASFTIKGLKTAEISLELNKKQTKVIEKETNQNIVDVNKLEAVELSVE